MPSRIAIIGGGFTGAVVAAQLARQVAAPAVIDVIEPRPTLGGGVAYSAEDPSHRINVPAARMTVFSDCPGHFDQWLRTEGALAADLAALWSDGSAFPQRAVFGRYVAGLVAEAGAARPGVTVVHRRTRATAIAPRAEGFVVHLAGDVALPADLVVLAVSHPPPSVPGPLRDAAAEGAPIVADPWAPGALDGVAPDHRVLVVGTGLTMADVVASLARRGHRGPILAVSRRGLLSRGHAFGAVAKCRWFETAAPPASARALCRAVRAQVRAAAAEGVPWQAVFDDVRGSGRRLWTALPEAEQRRLVRHLRPYWDVHRFRVAPQVEAAIADLAERGQFRSMAASLEGAIWDGDAVAVRLRPRRTHQESCWLADSVLVTTGPAHGGVLASNPALASLAAARLLQPDRVGLALAVDARSAAVGLDGRPRPDLLVAGPLARGRFGELMGLPQVSEHAAEVAGIAAEFLRGRAGQRRAAANDTADRKAAANPPVSEVV